MHARFRDLIWLLLAVVLYGNTIGHEYALDDSIVIVDNEFTQRGLEGVWPLLSQETFEGYLGDQQELVEGGRYRPLSLVTFAVEQAIFGDAPHVRHVVNLLLYALTGMILFRVLRRLVPAAAHWWTDVAWLGTLVFFVHPLHTEVVSNLKGRDELLALLLGLTALGAYADALRDGRTRTSVLAGATYFLAMLAKESAIPLLVLFPLMGWVYFQATPRSWKPLAAVLVAAAAYAGIRFAVTAGATPTPNLEILNDPFLHATLAERLATVSHALGRYAALLVFPHPLTHDYYFAHLKTVDWGDNLAIVAGAAHLALLGWTVRGLVRRQRWAFATAFYLVSLAVVSNLVVSVGVILAERFVYVPSVGFALLVATLIRRPLGATNALRWAVAGVGGVWLLALAATTVARNPAWHDNLTLFRTDLAISDDSAKLQAALGTELLTLAQGNPDPSRRVALLQEAIGHLQRSIEIYPGFGLGWVNLGVAQLERGEFQTAVGTFEHAIEVRPDLDDAYINQGIAWERAGDYEESLRTFRRLLRREPENMRAWLWVGLTFEAAGQPDSAKVSYQSMLRIDATHARALARLGSLYGQVDGDVETAGRYLRAALDAGNHDVEVYNNLGIVLVTQGFLPDAIALLERGLREHPGSPELHRTLAGALQRAGDDAEARHHMEEAQRLRSGN